MKKAAIIAAGLLLLSGPAHLLADECFEGDCENGFGRGFTEEGRVYEGQWLDGEPHGSGKLEISRDQVLEGIFKHGKFVKNGE